MYVKNTQTLIDTINKILIVGNDCLNVNQVYADGPGGTWKIRYKSKTGTGNHSRSQLQIWTPEKKRFASVKAVLKHLLCWEYAIVKEVNNDKVTVVITCTNAEKVLLKCQEGKLWKCLPPEDKQLNELISLMFDDADQDMLHIVDKDDHNVQMCLSRNSTE